MKVRSALRVTSTRHEFEEIPPGGAFLNSGSATVVTDARTRKRQTAVTTVPQVHVGGSSSSGSAVASSTQTEQRVVVPPEVPQDTRSSIKHMGIGQLRVKREVREVQGASLDADKREFQRLARDSAEHYFRDKQVDASDALTRMERC